MNIGVYETIYWTEVTMVYFIVFVIGALFGTIELMSRYKEEPFKIIFTGYSLLYTLLNGLASVLALYIINVNELDFGVTDNEDKLLLIKILFSGLASMTLFRSSLFNIKVGDSEVNVGPNVILQILLRTVDREVDRVSAYSRADEIPDKVKELSLETVSNDLSTICTALMSNLDSNEVELLNMKISSILRAEDITDETKKIAIASSLSALVGKDVLSKASKVCEKFPANDDIASSIEISDTELESLEGVH